MVEKNYLVDTKKLGNNPSHTLDGVINPTVDPPDVNREENTVQKKKKKNWKVLQFFKTLKMTMYDTLDYIFNMQSKVVLFC